MTRLWQRFVAPVGDAELPELERLLVRGVRVAALVYAPLLLPLGFALALRGGEPAADALALQVAAQAAIWICFAVSRTPLGRRRAEALLFTEVALGNAALLLGDPRPHAAASALGWAALFAPVFVATFAPWRPQLSLALGRGDGRARAGRGLAPARACRRVPVQSGGHGDRQRHRRRDRVARAPCLVERRGHRARSRATRRATPRCPPTRRSPSSWPT